MIGPGDDGSTLLARTIFTYSISHLSASDKVRFYYALKGRSGNAGIIQRFGLRHLAKTVLLVDPHHESVIASFLTEWGCPHTKLPVLIKGDDPRQRRPQNKIGATPDNTTFHDRPAPHFHRAKEVQAP